MPLCFLRAFKCWQDGKASDKEFLDYLLAQLRGVRHKDNDIPSIEEPLAAFEPWLACIRDLALADDYEPLDGMSSIGLSQWDTYSQVRRYFSVQGVFSTLPRGPI
jgi:hypothetical protein